MNSQVLRKVVFNVLKMLVLLIILIYLVGPFLVIISNSFKTEAEIERIVPTLVPLKFTLNNFIEMFGDRTFISSFVNSLKVALITMLVATCIAFPAAYAMARIKSRSTRMLQIWILLAYMLPGITLIVPMYIILRGIGLTNTHPGLIVVYSVWVLPFSIWMLRSFVESVPREIEEAALVDGCNLWIMFVKIIFPLVLPGIFTVGIFSFIHAWNEVFFAICLMKSPELLTLPPKIYQYIGISGQARQGMLAAVSFVAIIPGLITFGFFQRYFVTGMTSGSVKQ